MHRLVRSLLILMPFYSPAIYGTQIIQLHRDGRTAPKFIISPEFRNINTSTGEDLAKQYLRDHATEFGIAKNLSNIYLRTIRSSLIGFHYRFQQRESNYDVAHGEIVVSLNKAKDKIITIYNNLYPYTTALNEPPTILDETTAYDLAWETLRVHGELIEDPSISLSLKPIKKSLRLVYTIHLSVIKPYGAWQIDIDAQNGTIYHISDIRYTRRKKSIIDFRKYKGVIHDRQQSFEDWRKKKAKDSTSSYYDQRGDITTRVFDPDPRTTLNNLDLEDSSPDYLFENAYLDTILRDVSYNGNSYRLHGPWVRIINHDPPNTRPHSHDQEEWIFSRGQYPFNEAMTYFHIDQSQRYIQSLGFIDELGIQDAPIEVDADGANGDDNSYFQPNSNRLSFGHGCVDDNEDADVILHEYGHAIQDHINPNWIGGDTGAMGEGFGDYWAGSYSVSSDQGRTYFPNQVFSWDGHGRSNRCWRGRILNAKEAQYNHNRSYAAHIGIEGGYQSDELWSTPLFQSLLEILNQGYDREDADKIILQSHFGLGANLKMRDLALNTVFVASALFPNQPHAEIFRKNFLRHGIIREPKPDLEIINFNVVPHRGSILKPGSTGTINFEIHNKGSKRAQDVRLEIASDDPYISIQQEISDYGTIEINHKRSRTGKLSINLAPNLPCGKILKLSFIVSSSDLPDDKVIAKSVRLGEAIGIYYRKNINTPIPDSHPDGLVSFLSVSEEDLSVSQQFKVYININHSYRGDLSLQLTSPNQTSVTLFARQGSGENDIIGIFPDELEPRDDLGQFVGETLQGSWQLKVVDHAPVDSGILNTWGIEDITGYRCQEPQMH